MILAALPYVVMQLDRGIRRVIGFGGVGLVVVVLLLAAAIPASIEASERQPLGQRVDDLRDGVSALSGWVRMSGEITTLTSPQAVASGQQVQSLLVEPSGDAILLLSPGELDELSEITGQVSNSANAAETARRVGGPRFPDGDLEVIDRYVITVDDPIVPAENQTWAPVWAALGVAALLVIGRRIGYPVVRLRPDADPPVGPRPLAVGELLDVRPLEPEDETGPSLAAPWGRLERVPRHRDTDPYFELRVPGQQRPTEFRRHRWSRATPGTLWTIRERVPVVHLHDWGIEVVLAVRSEADRDRLLASFAIDDEAPQGAAAERVARA
jgi:hypothetical protein